MATSRSLVEVAPGAAAVEEQQQAAGPEHRAGQVLACVLAVAAVVLGVGGVAGSRVVVPDLLDRDPFPSVPLDPALAAVLGTGTAHLVVREDGWYDLRVLGLAADGTLAGGEQHLDRDWFDTWGRAVQVDLGSGTTGALDVVPSTVAARDATALLTLEHLDPRHDDDLVCTPLVGGRRTVLTDGSVVPGSVVLTGSLVAWSLRSGAGGPPVVQVAERTASGCPERARATGLEGAVVAADGDEVYVRPADGDWLVRVDTRTGRRLPLGRPGAGSLPGVPADEVARTGEDGIDAAGGRLAWWSGDALLVLDVDGGEVAVAAEGLEAVAGHGGSGVRVRVGERLVTWSTWPVDGDPARSRGVVHDPASGRTAELGGEALAGGPFVVWLAPDGYRFVRTP